MSIEQLIEGFSKLSKEDKRKVIAKTCDNDLITDCICDFEIPVEDVMMAYPYDDVFEWICDYSCDYGLRVESDE